MRLLILAALSSILLLNGLAGCAQGYFKGLDPESPIELKVSGYEIWIEKICETETDCPNSDVSIRTFVELEKEEIWLDPLMAYWPEVHDYTLIINNTILGSVTGMLCIKAEKYYLINSSRHILERKLGGGVEECNFGILFDGDIRKYNEHELKNASIEGHWAKLMSKYRYVYGSYSEELLDAPLNVEEKNVRWIVSTFSGVVETDTEQ